MKRISLIILGLILLASCEESALSDGFLDNADLFNITERQLEGSWRLISQVKDDKAVMLDSCALQKKITFENRTFTQENFSLNDENDCVFMATSKDAATFSVSSISTVKNIRFIYQDNTSQDYILRFIDPKEETLFPELSDTLQLTVRATGTPSERKENSEIFVRKYFD